MNSWNVFCHSIALGACVGLLAACQDRGQFQSYKATPQEIAAYKKAHAPPVEQRKVDPQATPEPAPIGGGAAAGDGKASGGVTPAQPKPVPEANVPSVPDSLFYNGAGAQNKTMAEAADVVTEIEKLLKIKNPEADKLVKGITATVQGSKGNSTLGLEAAVIVNGEPRLIFVAEQPLAAGKGAKVTPLLAEMKKTVQGESLPMTDQLIVAGVCRNESCNEVLIRLSFNAKDARVLAVFVAQLSNGLTTIVDSNLSVWPSFDEALAGIKSPDENKDGKNPPSTPGSDQSAKDGDSAKEVSTGGHEDRVKPAAPAKVDLEKGGTTEIARTSPAVKTPEAPAAVNAKPVPSDSAFSQEVARLKAASPQATTLSLPQAPSTDSMSLLAAKKPLVVPTAPKNFSETVAQLKNKEVSFATVAAAKPVANSSAKTLLARPSHAELFDRRAAKGTDAPSPSVAPAKSNFLKRPSQAELEKRRAQAEANKKAASDKDTTK